MQFDLEPWELVYLLETVGARAVPSLGSLLAFPDPESHERTLERGLQSLKQHAHLVEGDRPGTFRLSEELFWIASVLGQPDWTISAQRWDQNERLHLYGAGPDLVQLTESRSGYRVGRADRARGMRALEEFLPQSS